MTLAAVLCCTMTMAVFTACSNNDNPSVPPADVNKGVVIDLGSIVIKPYLQFGASLADVEAYMKAYYADWTDNAPDALDEYSQQEGSTWKKTYTKGGQTIKYLFGNASGGNLLLVSYGSNTPILFPKVKSELERNGFTYEGKLKFDDYDADLCNLYLSADKAIEAQFSYWVKDDGESWSISFQNFDEYDLQFLVPENYNKGIVLDFGSFVIKPYLQFGATYNEVYMYGKENCAEWEYIEFEPEGTGCWKEYEKEDKLIAFLYENVPGGSLVESWYGIRNSDILDETVKAELERKGFTYEGKLKFEDDDADLREMYLSADKTIAVQFSRYNEDGILYIAFKNFGENDQKDLEPA